MSEDFAVTFAIGVIVLFGLIALVHAYHYVRDLMP